MALPACQGVRQSLEPARPPRVVDSLSRASLRVRAGSGLEIRTLCPHVQPGHLNHSRKDTNVTLLNSVPLPSSPHSQKCPICTLRARVCVLGNMAKGLCRD